jgi:hypothetical protein
VQAQQKNLRWSMERAVGQVVAVIQSKARQWIQAGASRLGEVVAQRFIQ